MSIRRAEMVGLAMLGLMMALSVWGWLVVGFGGQAPTRWDGSGTPNGYSPATVTFSLVPGFTLVLLAIPAVLPRIDPRGDHLRQSGRAFGYIVLAIVSLLAVCHALIVAAAVTGHFEARLLAAALGLVLLVVGNYMGKVRSNWFFGFRTPWTLSSEISWDRTHRLGGRLFVLIGIVGLATAPFSAANAIVSEAVATIVSLPVLALHSYLAWRADPARNKGYHLMPGLWFTVATATLIGLVAAGTALASSGLIGLGQPVTGQARADVLAYSEGETDHLMSAFTANDRQSAFRDFNGRMQSMSQQHWDDGRASISAALGEYVSRSVSAVYRRDGYVTVVYVDHFTLRDGTMTVTFETTPPHRIAGWWFH